MMNQINVFPKTLKITCGNI